MKRQVGFADIWSGLKRTLRIEGHYLKNVRDVKGECFARNT